MTGHYIATHTWTLQVMGPEFGVVCFKHTNRVFFNRSTSFLPQLHLYNLIWPPATIESCKAIKMDFNGWVSVSKSLELKVINIEELQNALFFSLSGA